MSENTVKKKDYLKIKKVREDAVVPSRATLGSAGLDLSACIDAPITISPGQLLKIPTGIAIELPSVDLGAFIYARSGLGVKHGICLSNGVGVVDSDYRGEILVGLCNVSDKDYTVQPGERVAQLIVMPVTLLPVLETRELSDTIRGAGGFGSTGKV